MTDSKKELLRTAKFVLFSISAGVIQIAAFTLLEEVLHLPHWLAYLGALCLSVLWNFTLNRKFTFRSANNVPVAMLKVAVFYLIFTPLSTWWTAVLTGAGVGLNEYPGPGGHHADQFCDGIPLRPVCGLSGQY